MSILPLLYPCFGAKTRLWGEGVWFGKVSVQELDGSLGLDGESNGLVVGGGSKFNSEDEINKSWIVRGASRYLTLYTTNVGQMRKQIEGQTSRVRLNPYNPMIHKSCYLS